MESHTLRRSQSLKSLSEAREESWVMAASCLWNRKSVSQLVQQYQSCGDLRIFDKAERKVQLSTVTSKVGVLESQLDGRRRENGVPPGFGSLLRSRSMNYLPQKKAVGTSALRALFESKAALQKDYSSSPRLNTASVWGSLAAGDCPPVARKGGQVTPVKDGITQRNTQVERRKTISGLPKSLSRNSDDERKTQQLTNRYNPREPGRDRTPPSASVRDRSALYLSRVTATDSTGHTAQPEFIGPSGNRTKASKMANVDKQITVSNISYDDNGLPLPPPPLIPPKPLDYEGPSSLSGLPVPPPKETFSAFYQQRQKSELKRLFKHIHPDLKENINDIVDDELVEVMESQTSEAADSGYQGEVQSMKWIFENWTLDNIGDPHATKKLLEEENLKGGDVRSTSSKFEHIDSSQQSSVAIRQNSVRGDVRTSTWLFETQPLDVLNKLKREEGELVEALLKEPIKGGDVREARLLFESTPLSDLGRCNSIEDHNFLKLTSELQEQKGDVQKTVKLFQAEPCCAIRDNSGNVHEIRSICREEVTSSNTNTARWLFETQPLDTINTGTDGIRIIQGISLEEGLSGGVERKRWMFETQPFSMIQEGKELDRFKVTVADYREDADVENRRKLFETQPLAALKGDSAESILEKEQIIGGDVKTSMWLFETKPMETLDYSYKAGGLKKITLSADEQGAVNGKKQMFENYSTTKSTSVGQSEIEKGDVKYFKHLFETIPLSNIAHSDELMTLIKEKDISMGNVKGNKEMFETTPLYAIKDCSGHLHEVTTVSREEVIKGNVQNYKWMFETKPLGHFEEGKENVEVIKGITREEDTMGDVKMAKWLFETQTIDGIHSKFNPTEKSASVGPEESCKGDVKTCKWLFETQPVDNLHDKSETMHDKEAIENTNVKSFTWLFESQTLDSIKDSEEKHLKLCSTIQDSVKSEVGVKTVKRLFETETLDRMRNDINTKQDARYVSQVDVQSGDVSRVKELFESQSLDEIGLEMVTALNEQNQEEHIQKGSVHKFTWLFENHPINMINKDENTNTQRMNDVGSGDVHNKRFIFETFPLDEIHDQPLEEQFVCVEEPVSNVDVKSSTMMFESQPLYAIRDKEGQFHEVTTVKKEEVMSGDVRGARWMFETKPLDTIKAENEVYVIRAVTQEDVRKGDVKSARWKFETQPLDSFTSQEEPSVRVAEDIGSSNVELNKKIFESEQSAQKKYVRMVSVTDVQQGDVRTSTWLFENQAIDSLKGEPQEQCMVNTVQREDNQKGDVKRCTWLFESQPLDKIKEADNASAHVVEEDRPKADVKTTTWLFETTPLDKITVNSVADTLTHLCQLEQIHSSGIIIEANDSMNVNMAKYQLATKESVQIQKEEFVEGNIRNIMLQLLYKPSLKPQVTLLREIEEGKVNTAIVELPVNQPTSSTNLEKDQIIQNIVQTCLSVQSKHMKKGIIMQESVGGQGEMIVYSLISDCETKTESQEIEKGDVKSTIGNLLATASNQRTSSSCRVDANEKGNVNLYKSCIEKGDLQYLKRLQTEESEGDDAHSLLPKDHIEIVQGDIKEAKRSLYQQKDLVERTISDVLPGDVKNTKKVFSSECSSSIENSISKEEIISGDVLSTKQQLAVKQPVMVEKEGVVAGDIKATMQSLERAKQQSMHIEREVIKPGTIYDMDLSVETPEVEESQAQREEIISGDVKAAKKSLEMAKNQSLHVEREVIVPGKIYNLNVSAAEQSSSTVMQTTSSSSFRSQQIRATYKKVSDAMKGQACQQGEMSQTVVVNNCTQDSLPTFVNTEYDVQTTEQEAEAIKGDVKAAIRSLQSAAMEEKLLEKEDIVRGNMELALQSLQKSSINVSKGDFKSAMIYRNSGKVCAGGSKTVHKQGVVVSLPTTDTELSPSISVTYEEPSSITQNPTPKTVVMLNGNSNSSSPEGLMPPPLPQKTREKPQDLKPALPPKPQWTKSTVDDQTIKPSSASEISNAQPVVPPKFSVSVNQCPIPDLQKAKENDTIIPNQETLHETCNQKSAKETIYVSKGITAKYEIPQKHSNTQETENAGSKGITAKYEIPEKHSNTQETENANKETSGQDRTIINSNGTEIEMNKNIVQKINAAEEIRMCIQTYAEDARNEMNMGFQAALQNFGNREKGTAVPVFSEKIKVVTEKVIQEKQTNKSIIQNQTKSQHPKLNSPNQQNRNTGLQITAPNIPHTDACPINKNNHNDKQQPEDRVVLRKKKKKETEDERRQRLSVHKEEIMKGNVKAAMEIFENLRKREELKTILSQVQEIEEETIDVDVSNLKTLYENVPAWIVTPSRNANQSNKKGKKKVETETHDDEVESTSSVETAFEDLEKASKEIMNLKEQTIAKLIDIEEAIKKALYSVSSLKCEADIAGLSGLFDESLKSEQCCQPANNIRKISIVSSKAKPEKIESTQVGAKDDSATNMSTPQKVRNKGLIRQSSAPSSPSFISIHSAARKPTEKTKLLTSTFKPKAAENYQGGRDPATAQRKVSVLEVKTVPDPPIGIIGTKTVSETYEETDAFGNSFVSSKTSTFVSKQCDSKTSAMFEGPTRYEVITSPLMRRSGRPSVENVLANAKEEGTVFVTFSQPATEKH